MVNIGCELVGCYLAALFVDYEAYGRKRIQMVSFILWFILFINAAGAFPILDKEGPGGQAFEFLVVLDPVRP